MDAGEHPCDKRRSVAEYRQEFPGIDFSEVQVQALRQKRVIGVMQAKQCRKLACCRMTDIWTSLACRLRRMQMSCGSLM